MNTSMMARLKELETENARLKNDVCRRTAQSRNTQRGHRKKVVKPTGVGAKGGEGKNYPCASRVCSVWHQRDLLSLSGEAQR
jgi:hypothetical protein